MSFVTKLFVILSLLLSMAFLVVAGALVAKQENFKHRYAAEAVERQRDDQLQDRLRNRLASAQERRRREIRQMREKILLAKEKVVRARHSLVFASIAEQRVAEAMNSFSDIAKDFGPIMDSYQATLDNLIQKGRALAERRNEMTRLRSEMWVHLAQAQAEVGRLREHLNVLDYKLYVLRMSNFEKRQTISLYMEIDPGLAQPGLGETMKGNGEVVVVDAEHNTVVINLGHNEDIQPHAVFTITRNGEYVAQVEITQVFEMRSSGYILQQTQSRAVLPGDSVRPRAVFGASVPR
ncbi:MAG: hypothetical protein AB7K09_23085 [Planctomycetota bacterium]